jgi:hypothetical protein
MHGEAGIYLHLDAFGDRLIRGDLTFMNVYHILRSVVVTDCFT